MTHEQFEDAVASDARGAASDSIKEVLRADLDRWHDYLLYIDDDVKMQLTLRDELHEANEDTKTPESTDFHVWKARVLEFKRALARKIILVRSLIADRDGKWRRSDDV